MFSYFVSFFLFTVVIKVQVPQICSVINIRPSTQGWFENDVIVSSFYSFLNIYLFYKIVRWPTVSRQIQKVDSNASR